MCGIAGIVGKQYGLIGRGTILNAMLRTMEKRGPDGIGTFIDDNVAMGMRRLSVLDPEHGWQPLKNEDESVIVFQNGEIYNFPQLKNELLASGWFFRTNCDTEVILKGYEAWGIETLLDKLDGMFAIAIYDRRSGILHLARDRFGEKPLFYAVGKFGFAFGSNTISPALLLSQLELSPEGLNYYLAFHYVPGDATILRNVHRLLPGFRMEVDVQTCDVRTIRYFIPEQEWGVQSDSSNLESLLLKSVQSRLISDVPVGIFLSGGLDSSLLAAMAAREHPGIQTFSIGFEKREWDETPYAKRVAEHIGSTHFHYTFGSDSFHRLLPEVAGKLDEPVGDQAILPLYILCEAASREVTVVLSGEGADEVFGGYGYYRPYCPGSFSLSERLRTFFRFGGKVVSMPATDNLIDNVVPISPSGFPLLTDVANRMELCGGGLKMEAYERYLMDILEKTTDPLQRATAADLLTWLPDDLLVKLDRVCMMHSLEGRAPYLQPEVVNVGLRLAPAERYDGRTRKVALRTIAGKYLPGQIAYREKQGFILPMRRWIEEFFEKNGGPKQYFKEHELPVVNMPVLTQLVQKDVGHGVQRERLLFAVILLSEWWVRYEKRWQELKGKLNGTR